MEDRELLIHSQSSILNPPFSIKSLYLHLVLLYLGVESLEADSQDLCGFGFRPAEAAQYSFDMESLDFLQRDRRSDLVVAAGRGWE